MKISCHRIMGKVVRKYKNQDSAIWKVAKERGDARGKKAASHATESCGYWELESSYIIKA